MGDLKVRISDFGGFIMLQIWGYKPDDILYVWSLIEIFLVTKIKSWNLMF
jgi:hypothetical protein